MSISILSLYFLFSKTRKGFLAESDRLKDSITHTQNPTEGTKMAVTRVPLSEAEEQQRERQQKLEMSTAEIGLSVRTTNCLEEKGIFTVQDLLQTTPDDLLSISNFGEKTLEEVYKSLERCGFSRTSAAAA